MKFSLSLLLLSTSILSGCEYLKARAMVIENRSLIGRWNWEESRNGISESGYLILYDNLTFSHQIIYSNPTEKINEIRDRFTNRWSVNGSELCFSRGDFDPPDCERFSILVKNGERIILYNAGVFDESIEAHKVDSLD